MKVSIIIPCYNLGEYVVEAIESIQHQTYSDWELIIINDGSSDEATNTLLSTLSYPKTTIHTTKNQGVSSARNFGISLAKGEYIACLDADDKFLPDFLQKTVALLEADSQQHLGFVTTWIKVFGAKDEVWQTGLYDPILLATRNIVHVASLFRKSAWQAVNGYTTARDQWYEDWDFWLKIVSLGLKWDVVPEPLFNYRVRNQSRVFFSNQKRPELFKAIVENNQEFYTKNLTEIIAKFFSIAEEYEVLSHQLVKQEERIGLKDAYIEDLSKSKKVLTSNLAEKQKYIEELEIGRTELEKAIKVKDLYIHDLEKHQRKAS